MRFTTERPKETGFYFVKYMARTGEEPRLTVGHAYNSGPKGARLVPDRFYFESMGLPVISWHLVAFAGPIQPPLEQCPGCGEKLSVEGNCPSVNCSHEHATVK